MDRGVVASGEVGREKDENERERERESEREREIYTERWWGIAANTFDFTPSSS